MEFKKSMRGARLRLRARPTGTEPPMNARKIKMLTGLVVWMAAWIAPAYGSNVMFVASGDPSAGSRPGVVGSGDAVSTQAMFSVSEHQLKIYLQSAVNVSSPSSPVLTGLTFDVAMPGKNPGTVSTTVGNATITGARSSAQVQAIAWENQQLAKSSFDVATIGLTAGAMDALVGSQLANLGTGNLAAVLTTTYIFNLDNLTDNAVIQNVSFQFGAMWGHAEQAVGGPAAVTAPLPGACAGGLLLLGAMGGVRSKWIKWLRHPGVQLPR
jgi:hypothetical protein